MGGGRFNELSEGELFGDVAFRVQHGVAKGIVEQDYQFYEIIARIILKYAATELSSCREILNADWRQSFQSTWLTVRVSWAWAKLCHDTHRTCSPAKSD